MCESKEPEYPSPKEIIFMMENRGIEIDEDGIITIYPSDDKFHYFAYDDLLKIRRKI